VIYRLICALLITAGLFLFLRVRLSDVMERLSKPFVKRYEREKRIRQIVGKSQGKLVRTIQNAKQMLNASGAGEQFATYQWMAVLLSAFGLLIGLALDNLLAALVLAIGLGCSPLIIIRIRTGDYVRSLHEKLESAMSTVTNSYIATGDLIGAVESSLHLLPAPVDEVFKQFYMQTQIIDSNVVKALQSMRDKIGNRYWRDWCNVLIQCQRDRQLRYALSGIVGRLGETRRVQLEVDTTIRKQTSDYIMTVLIVLGAIPLMGCMMPEWYDMLTNTLVGKITLAGVLAAVLATAAWVSQLYRPVEGGEKG